MTDIRLLGVTKVFGSRGSAALAVDNVTLNISPGEFFFLLGPSGCGKTTLLRIVAGLVRPDAGKVFFGQQDVTEQPTEKRSAAMVFQNYALWPHMTVAQNVEFAPRMQNQPRTRRRQLLNDNLARVEMEQYAKRKPNQLSGGQQQRVALARALAAQANCLLLDEPLSNLDARLRQHMRSELRRLVKSSGVTAIYVTHDQSEALLMADRIAVMNAGRVVQIGTPQELYEQPATQFVADFLGEANFVPGKVVAIEQFVQIQTPAGSLFSSRPHILEPGSRVTCFVRPEKIAIKGASPAGTAAARGAFSLPAVVAHSTYLGGVQQYLCRLGGGDADSPASPANKPEPAARQEEFTWKVAVVGPAAKALLPGDAVQLMINPDDVVLLTQ
jgi:iron(III) transport system ATP-binding protein